MSGQCIICRERPREVRLQCGHLFACTECISGVAECAICRQTVLALFHVQDNHRQRASRPSSSCNSSRGTFTDVRLWDDVLANADEVSGADRNPSEADTEASEFQHDVCFTRTCGARATLYAECAECTRPDRWARWLLCSECARDPSCILCGRVLCGSSGLREFVVSGASEEFLPWCISEAVHRDPGRSSTDGQTGWLATTDTSQTISRSSVPTFSSSALTQHPTTASQGKADSSEQQPAEQVKRALVECLDQFIPRTRDLLLKSTVDALFTKHLAQTFRSQVR